MWMIDPKLLCRTHLLGEHFEIHKHRHNFVKKHSIANRVALGQIEPKSMKTRHDALAAEMLRRGFKHKSPYEMPDISHLTNHEQSFTVDLEQSKRDLAGRCEECRRMLQ